MRRSSQADRAIVPFRRNSHELGRLAATLNAVEGIPTAMLEVGLVRSLVVHRVEQLVRETPGLQALLSRFELTPCSTGDSVQSYSPPTGPADTSVDLPTESISSEQELEVAGAT